VDHSHIFMGQIEFVHRISFVLLDFICLLDFLYFCSCVCLSWFHRLCLDVCVIMLLHSEDDLCTCLH